MNVVGEGSAAFVLGGIVRLGTAAVFAQSGVHALRDLAAHVEAVRAYQLLPDAVVPVAAFALAVANMAIAALLLPSATAASAAQAGCVAHQSLARADGYGVRLRRPRAEDFFLSGVAEFDSCRAARTGVTLADARRHGRDDVDRAIWRGGVVRGVVFCREPADCQSGSICGGSRMSPLGVAVLVLFILNAGLVLVVLALARQVGLLHERISPVGALALEHGPKVGEAVPALNLTAMGGEKIRLGEAWPRSRMVFFLSPTCPVCKKLLPALRSLAVAERDRLEIVLASDGEVAEHAALVRREKLDLPYVLSAELGMTFRIGKLPYAVLIGADGTVRAKGLVNNREQLESLLAAEDLGVGSMQDYLRRQAAE